MDALMLFDGSYSASGVLSGTSVQSGTTFTTGSGTDSANYVDISPIGNTLIGWHGTANYRDIGSTGEAHDLNVICQVATTFAGSGASLQVEVQTAPDSGTGTPGSWSPLVLSNVIPVASLTAGTEICRITLPIGVQRFLKLTYLVTGANMTAGAILSFLALDREYLGPAFAYPSGYSNQYL
jgi:hypothetical protein